eukprot:TRINITY_DN55012_c0_g1_i1.p1 TRINITY_DN55012_c0_g1~~TRINITY_DN55012_c0_g1_i1.p1  ORF type:complete len:204 (-),score=51.48 TRINITY_DN55012_c0_g1_i1:150-761(-)
MASLPGTAGASLQALPACGAALGLSLEVGLPVKPPTPSCQSRLLPSPPVDMHPRSPKSGNAAPAQSPEEGEPPLSLEEKLWRERAQNQQRYHRAREQAMGKWRDEEEWQRQEEWRRQRQQQKEETQGRQVLQAGAADLAALGLPPGEIPALSDLKVAYREAARRCHPDRPHNAERKEEATEEFQRIKAAFDALEKLAAHRMAD